MNEVVTLCRIDPHLLFIAIEAFEGGLGFFLATGSWMLSASIVFQLILLPSLPRD